MDWAKWEVSMTRVLESNGSFSCGVNQVLKDVTDLCKKSEDEWSMNKTAVFEQAFNDTIVSCEVRQDGVVVILRTETQEAADLSCSAGDSGSVIQYQPALLFALTGALSTITFTPEGGGETQTVSASNCRRKLKRILKSKPDSLDDLAAKMGQDANDPSDLNTANRLCAVYDTHSAWKPLRRQLRLLGWTAGN
jgi:hypothetical protein